MQKILVNSDKKEIQIAVLDDDKLVDIYIDTSDEIVAGNIYTGLIKNKLKSMQAFFVDIGFEKNGFLNIENEDKQDKSSQTVLVQVKKDETEEKGANLTKDISLNGKYLVLLPMTKEIQFSKKINSDKQKDELLGLIKKINVKEYGMIIRNDILGVEKNKIEKEYNMLTEKWEKIEKDYTYKKVPALLYKQNIEEFIFNNLVSKDTAKIVINNEEIYNRFVEYAKLYDEKFKEKIELYEDDRLSMFDLYKAESQFETALNDRVWLKSGAELIFAKTEAMTVVDVDTSKFIGKKNKEQTIFKTNIEAAKEIAIQVRLRNISGIIIIDFINMKDQKEKEEVLKVLKDETAKDRVKTFVVGMTKLGLVEMTRQKSRKSLDEIYKKDCSVCRGKGKVRRR